MEENESLEALHRALIQLHDQLSNAINQVDDIDAKEAVFREMLEISHRVALIGQLLFKQRTDAMDTALAEIEGAEVELKAAIAQLDAVNDFIKTVTRFLSLVDTVIDIAKLV